jgi:ribosome-associated heat shock protein Hsp15
VGDVLRVKNEAGDFQLDVVLLSEIRGPALVAQTLYSENRGEPRVAGEVGGRAKSDALGWIREG